MPAH